MKKNKIFWIVGSIILIGGGIWYFKYKKGKATPILGLQGEKQKYIDGIVQSYSNVNDKIKVTNILNAMTDEELTSHLANDDMGTYLKKLMK